MVLIPIFCEMVMIPWMIATILNKRLIDFQSINGKFFQITQGSLSGTEIVNRNLNSEFSELFQGIDGHPYIGHNCGLSDLDIHILWLNSLRYYSIFDFFNQVRFVQTAC